MSLSIRGLLVRQGSFTLGPIDLTLAAQERLLLVGPSGSGKSTLLHAIAGLLDPQAGKISLGESVFCDVGVSIPPERRGVGMVFQDLALWPHLTVREHLTLPLRYRNLAPAAAADLAERLLRRVQLAEKTACKPEELSGGERHRLALARAIAGQPRLWLFDEPLGHLDPHRRREAMRWIDEMHRENPIPLLHVTHDLLDLAAWKGRIALLHAGKLEQLGFLEEFLQNPRTPFVREFSQPLLDCKNPGEGK